MPVVFSQDDFYDLVQGRSDDGLLDFGRVPARKILVEGDSWVSHPFLRNLANQLDILGGDDFGILNLAVPGDTASKMFIKNGKQLKKIGQLIGTKTHGYEFDLIFVSAAGNDIVGEELASYVDHHGTGGRSGADLLNTAFDDAVETAVEGFRNLIKLRNRSRANKTTPIVTHVYCYLEPRLVGTKVFGAMFGKGWIKRYLDPKQIPQADQVEIARALLDRFHAELSALESSYDHFHVVDTRKLLTRYGKPDVNKFHDEIHPTNAGFEKVAKAIRKRMKDLNVWPG